MDLIFAGHEKCTTFASPSTPVPHAPHPHNSSNMNVFLHQCVTKIRICQHATRPPATPGKKLPGTKTGETTNTWSELLVHYSRVDIKILTWEDHEATLLWTAQVDTCTALETNRISTKNVDRYMKNTHSVFQFLKFCRIHIISIFFAKVHWRALFYE